MSSQQPVDEQGRPLWPVLVNPTSPMPAFAMTSDGRMAFTHLSFDEQGAQYRAEQGQAQQEQAGEQGGEASGGGEEAEQDDAPVAYPLVSTQGSGLFAASSSSGAALGSPLTPEEQMARLRAELARQQSEQKTQEEKDQQAAAARE